MENSGISQFISTNRLTLKGMLVAFLIVLMLIPSLLIMNLVEERSGRRDAVAQEVGDKWANRQTVTGPFLIIPYWENPAANDNKTTPVKKFAYFLPSELKINGVLQSELRHRSIYRIPVYRANLEIEGSFDSISTDKLHIAMGDLLPEEALVCIGIDDFRGIENQLSLNWNTDSYAFTAGLPDDRVIKAGLSAPIRLDNATINAKNNFKMQLHLRGSENISFTPVGKTTNVSISSTWTNPSFDGNFLPSSPPSINNEGFRANWQIQDLNRNYPQSWKDSAYPIDNSRFGVTLLQPVDSYSKTMRTVKYAILFIALTFGLYFFVEIFQKKSVHPIQYIMVGLALCIFYTLLLSISEYIPFNLAYPIAAAPTITLITLYTKSVFHRWKIAALFALMLSALYVFIFVLLQLQDGALLLGSIGLFLILAVAMYFSRKINWYGQGSPR